MTDLVGKRFGKLTVISFSRRETSKRGMKTVNRYYWNCICDCGKTVERRQDGLSGKRSNGNMSVVSCGCERGRFFTERNPRKTHGMTKTRLYKIYAKMKERCYDPNYRERHLYGGRGIKICQEWLDSFEAFAKWSYENGYNDTLSIDRIDPNKDYEPSNCRWATVYQQANNKRNNITLTYNGETLTLPQWARKLNLPYSTLADRMKKGKNVEEILYPNKKR